MQFLLSNDWICTRQPDQNHNFLDIDICRSCNGQHSVTIIPVYEMQSIRDFEFMNDEHFELARSSERAIIQSDWIARAIF